MPTLETLLKLAAALDVSLDDLKPQPDDDANITDRPSKRK